MYREKRDREIEVPEAMMDRVVSLAAALASHCKIHIESENRNRIIINTRVHEQKKKE